MRGPHGVPGQGLDEPEAAWERLVDRIAGRPRRDRRSILRMATRHGKAKSPGTKISIGSQGDYFVKHTFRLCVGPVNLARNMISIQPWMYFNDFLKAVTPGVRVTF